MTQVVYLHQKIFNLVLENNENPTRFYRRQKVDQYKNFTDSTFQKTKIIVRHEVGKRPNPTKSHKRTLGLYKRT